VFIKNENNKSTGVCVPHIFYAPHVLCAPHILYAALGLVCLEHLFVTGSFVTGSTLYDARGLLCLAHLFVTGSTVRSVHIVVIVDIRV